MTDAVPAITIEELQARLTEASRRKAHLELVNRMLTQLADISGLEDMVSHIITTLMNTIGAANIALYYRIDNLLQYRDVYGEARQLDECSDQQVRHVLETQKPLRIHTDTNRGLPLGPTGLGATESWYFPLLARDRLAGVVAMLDMQLTDDVIWREIQPFFRYAALMLDNEINSYSQLAESKLRLQESEERFRTLFEESPFGVVLVDPESLQVLHFNPAARSELGYDADEFSRLRVTDFTMIDDDASAREKAKNTQQSGSMVFESIHRTKQGVLRNIMVYLKQITVAGRPMIQSIYRDITESKRSRKMLELYRYALDNARDSIFMMGSDARFQFVNQAACQTLGYSRQELLELHVFDIDPDFPREIWPDHWLELRSLQSMRIESRHRTKDGRLIPVEISLCHFSHETEEYIVAVARDLTERKRQVSDKIDMERRLLHAQKLESLGVLAGGIAHDFNNLLAAIIGNLDLSLLRMPEGYPARTNIENALLACQRAADLTRQMLAYSGKGAFEHRRINLGELVRRNAELLRTSIPRTVSMLIEVPDTLPPISGDPGQIQQVVMNLITNAAEAIAQQQGLITITSGADTYAADALADSVLDEKPAPGRFTWLEVADNGSGMDDETRQRIFEPFFTTKFTGRGLGMSAVLGIIRAHHGAILIESAVGAGTRFRVLFPAIDADYDEECGESPAVSPGISDCTVLVADDEPMICEFCCACLDEMGITTLAAADGAEAVELFRAHRDDISLVILDLTMPRMDGVAAFDEIKRIRPDIRVIISSGYGEQNMATHFTAEKPDAFIQKPYVVKKLQDIVLATLEQLR